MNRTRFSSALAMVALAATLSPSFLQAQITFQRTYGGAGDDYGYSVQQNADSGYIVAGQAAAGDYYLIRTNAAGYTLWSKTWDYWVGDVLYGVLQTADGGFVTVGQHWGDGRWFTNLIWTDAQGSRSGETGWDNFCAYSLQQTADGGCIIAGTNYSGYDIGLIRTRGSGSTGWRKSFGHPGIGCGYSAHQTADSGFVETGFLSPNGDDIYLVKTNSSGDTMWTRLYGGDSSETGSSVQQTTDGGYIITGDTKSFGNGGRDVYLVKTDTVGDTIWTRTFGGTEDDEGHSVQQLPDDGFIIAGNTESFGAGGRDVCVIRTDANGDTIWTRTFGGADDDDGNSVQQTTDGGYVIAGYTKSFGAGGADVWLIKTDSLGNVGVAESNTTPTRTQTLSLSCEPNPCRSSTVLHSTAGPLDHSTAVLRIYDSQGCLVRSVSGIRTSSFPLDLRALPSGTYFARVDVGAKHATTRVILQH